MLMTSDCSEREKAAFRREVSHNGYRLRVVPPTHPMNRTSSCPACDGAAERFINIEFREGDKPFITFAMLRLVRDIERAGFRFPKPFIQELNAWADAQPFQTTPAPALTHE